jgi:hypothetical protein
LLGVGRLSGHLVNADGTPASNWRVLLQGRGGQRVATTTLDNAGAFSFGFVLATDYKVEFADWSTGARAVGVRPNGGAFGAWTDEDGRLTGAS